MEAPVSSLLTRVVVFLFHLIPSLLFFFFFLFLSLPLLHTCTFPFSRRIPAAVVLEPSVSPPRRLQSEQIKVSSCPFAPADTHRRRQTDPLMSAFIPCVLGIKCDISPPTVTPFVTPCVFLYEITVLIGENCRLQSSSWVSGDNGRRVTRRLGTENHL